MFNILQRINNPKYSWYERAAAKTKYSIYSLMHELLQCQIAFPLFFNLLLIVETGQFLWYAIHPDYNFLWITEFSQYPRDIIKFLQFDSLLREGDQSTYYAILYICFSIQLAMLIGITLVLFMLERSKKKGSSLVFFTLRVLSFYAQLITTIGPIPFANIFFVAIVCRDDDPLRGSTECYTGVHLVNMAVGIFGLVTLLIFSFFSQLLFIDMNPSSNIPFACPQTNLGMIKLLLKLVLPLYITLDYNLEHADVFVGIYCLIWLFILAMRYSSRGYYNEMVTLCATLMEGLLFWAALVATIHAFLDDEAVDDTGLFYFLFASPFATVTFYKIFTYERGRLLKSNTRKFTRAIQFEKYINLAMQLVETIEEPESRIELEGLLRYHVKFCRNEGNTCPCSSMAPMISKEGEEASETKKTWYQFIKSIIAEGMSSFYKNPRLHLQHAYFQQEKLHNRFKALYELVITEENRPNLQEEFSIFRYRNIIEKEMIEDDIRNFDIRGIDVNLIVHFQEKLVSLQAELGKAVNMQLDFWRELEQVNPNVQKLLSLGSRITIQGDVVKSAYTKICELNPNHIRLLKMYGNFLLEIWHDKVEAQRLLENADYAERSILADKTFMDNDRYKYSENSKTCIITCSGNLHSMGKILSANTEALDVLQYVHTDLIGHNVSHIMPDIIADIHDNLMKKYFESGVGKVMGKERIVFATTSLGYIVPCTLMIKVFPNLDDGIRVVGFLRRTDARTSEDGNHKAHYVLYGGEDNTIYGVSENCYESFGISARLTTGDEKDFTISAIFPDLLGQNEDELKSMTGLMCTIDTTSIEQNFLIGRQDSNVDEEDEETKQKKYRTSKVRVVLLQEDVYLDRYNVKVLKFVEVSAHHEIKVKGSEIVTIEQTHKKKHFNEETGSQESDLEVSRSEGSNVSLGSQIGEDSRQLKDMKAKITEKNIPSSISVLRNFSMFFALSLIIIIGVQLDKRISMNDDLLTGLAGTRKGYERYSTMTKINGWARSLSLAADNIVGLTDDYMRAEFGESITEFTAIQFDIAQVLSYINETIGKTPESTCLVRNKLLDESIAVSTRSLDQALFEYISAAQKLNKLGKSGFNQPIGPTSAEIPFYYIQRNGLSALRQGVKLKADEIFQSYQDRTYHYSDFSLITMIVAIVFLILCQCVIAPKIFAVLKTNIRVLALFGYISPEEVEELAEKCERYMMTYLDEISAKREESYYESNDENEGLERSLQQQPDNGSKNLKRRPSNMDSQDDSLQQNYTLQMKEFSYKEDLPHLRVKNQTASQLMMPDQESAVQITNKSMEEEASLESPTNKKQVKDEKPKEENNDMKNKEKDKKEEEEVDEEHLAFLEERSKKLRDSKDNSRKLIVFQVMFVGLAIIAYFLGDFFHEENFLKNFRQGLDHLKVISERLPNIRYTIAFSLEEFAEDNLSVVYPDIDPNIVATNNYRTQYSDEVSINQALIQKTFKMSFPSNFDDYLAKLLSYNNDDVCALYYTDNSIARTTCEAVGVQRGLIQSEVTIVGDTKAAITQFYATPNRDLQALITALTNLQTANTMRALIGPITISLIQDFSDAFNSYFDSMFLLQRLKFLIFFFCLVASFLFLWLPYLKRLQSQIFRTKGLLNMIPMEMLKKNTSLREKFTSNEILRAVQ